MLKNKRLETVYGFADKGDVVCDIGTDHAFIPCELIENGICEKAVITDISKQSLEKGMANLKKSGFENKIKAYCADGTLGADIEGVNRFIIAGMGGELIVKIIENDERLHKKGLKFVLQPMSKGEILRKYLFENGFEIKEEVRCISEMRVYTVINAEYTGKISEYTFAQQNLGKDFKIENEADKKYFEKILSGYETRLQGLLKSEKQLNEEVKTVENQIMSIKNYVYNHR